MSHKGMFKKNFFSNTEKKSFFGFAMSIWTYAIKTIKNAKSEVAHAHAIPNASPKGRALRLVMLAFLLINSSLQSVVGALPAFADDA